VIYTVHLSSKALRQLDELEAHIAEAGSPLAARRFIDSIVDYCESFQTFPQRGTQRPGLSQAIRMIGYRRRVMIAFEVTKNTVIIHGIYYGGQDYEADLRDGDE
jgi:toxin ParE1/3/4